MSEQSQKTYIPIPPPNLFTEDPSHVLTEDEQKMYDEVFLHFSIDGYKLPGIEEGGELMEAEKYWLSRECLLRYLRAAKWKVDVAVEKLVSTLKWRREFGVYDTIDDKLVEPEAITGKQIIYGYDTKGHPGLYLLPSRQNTTEAERQIQHVVWSLERTIDLMGPGVEKLDLLINYADKAKNPSISTSRAVLNILQDHYPERLGLSLIINVPFLVTVFYKVITPFIDPVTREKLKFNPDVLKEEIFTPDMLMKEWWGGDRDFEYEHEKYWPELIKMCEERAKSNMQRWRELGGKIGLKEWDYKQDKIAEAEAEKETTTPQEMSDDSKPVEDGQFEIIAEAA